MKNILCTILMLSFLAFIITPVMAQGTAQPATPPAAIQQQPGMLDKIGGFLDSLFKKVTKKERQGDPSGTLVAPFAESGVKPLSSEERYRALTSSNNVAIDQPHRSEGELAEWLMQALAQSLSFNSTNLNELLKQMANGYSPAALEQFKAWTTDSGIMAALETNGLQLNGFVTDAPFLLNQGVIEGRFRWLFEVPVMISFVPRGTTQAVNNAEHSSRLIVTVQIGRVENSILEHGVQIESWAVRTNDRKN